MFEERIRGCVEAVIKGKEGWGDDSSSSRNCNLLLSYTDSSIEFQLFACLDLGVVGSSEFALYSCSPSSP